MKNKTLAILMAAILIAVIIITQQYILDYYSINEDIKYLFFVNNFPKSLDNSILAQFSFSKWVTTTIYLSYFYIFISKFVDIIFVSYALDVLALLISIVYIFRLGLLVKNKRFALILALLFILQPWTHRPFTVGVSRTFAFPLLIAFLYYFIKKDTTKTSLIFLFQAMIYPPIFLISLIAYGLSLADINKKRIAIDIKRNYLVFISIFISFMLILIPMKLVNYGIKEQYKFKDLIYMPELYETGTFGIAEPLFAGRVPFTSDLSSTIKSLTNLANFGINQPIYINSVFVLFLLSLVFMIVYRKKIFRLPKEIYLMAVSSLIMQFLAFLLFIGLYLPSRYVKYTLPLFFIIILANGLYFLSIDKKHRFVFNALIFCIALFYLSKLILNPAFSIEQCGDKKVYDFIKTMPPDTHIAGFPTDMGCVALYGQKKPFIMSELNTPFFKDYYGIVKKRNFGFFKAYYSENKEEVLEFCKNNALTHIVVDKSHFDRGFLNGEIIYGEPYSSFIKNIAKDINKFYLQNPDNKIFESGAKSIVRC